MNLSLSTALHRLLVGCGLLLPAALLAVDDVTVASHTYTSGSTTVQADNTITASPNVIVNNGADVTFQAGGHVSLGTGFRVDAGGLFHLAVGESLPYSASFETAEGFTSGSIVNQRGWTAIQGSASIGSTDAYVGSSSLVISTGVAQQGFLISAAPSVTFVDLFVKPVAASSAANSSLVQTESAKIGFQTASGQGEVYVFDGAGANVWVATGVRFAINGSNQATSWLHLTVRADYTHHTWDLSINGVLADYDLAFLNTSESFFRNLTLTGATTATAYFDGILAQSTNPLFTDSDKDGMPDTWETANGLNNASDDRNSDHDGDGKSNIEEYFLGTAANNADVTPPTAPTSTVIVATAPSVIGVSWSGATDSGAGTSGVAGYNVYCNGVKVNTTLVTDTTFTDTGLSAATTYSYTIKTVDVAGNLSAASTALSVATSVSSTSGSFELFSPLP